MIRALLLASVFLCLFNETVRADVDAFDAGNLHVRRISVKSAIGGPDVRYWLSPPKVKAPIVLFIQGSGCTPAFHTSNGAFYSTVFSLTTVAAMQRYAVMVVDKPFALDERPSSPGSARECSENFNRYFTLESWSQHILAAIADARTRTDVDPQRILVIGISEGATVAARLAALDPSITHVALVSGSGTSQVYDFIVEAYRSRNSDTERLARIAEIETTVDEIKADPQSSSKFAWGHPYKRWTSFFGASPSGDILRSNAKVYLLEGMSDSSVPALSTESMFATLQGAGRDVTIIRVPDAEHSIVRQGQSILESEPDYLNIVRWFDRSPSNSKHE